MAFLDNSGDIILDAVLTDTGRARLARGDGTFKITKFAFGDDEIDYANYENDNYVDGAHPSGSAYYDLEILQTPVLEAFTNNPSTLKSNLLSIPRTNLLYLPVLKVQRVAGGDGTGWNSTTEAFHVLVDQDTNLNYVKGTTANFGIIDGRSGAPKVGGRGIQVHQGLDTTEISNEFQIDADLYETQYIIEMDNRLGGIVDGDGNAATLSFVDDDNIATYFLSAGTDSNFVLNRETIPTDEGTGDTTRYPIQGPRGSRLLFSIVSSIEIRTSNYLFTKLGTLISQGEDLAGMSTPFNGNTEAHYYIDTHIRVTGATTGYRLDIPVRFIKEQ